MSKFRSKFLGPKLANIIPLRGEKVSKFHKYNIRKSTGTVKIYDVVEKQWYSGKAVQFSISFITHSMLKLFEDENMLQLTELIQTL